jgi:transposase
LDVRQKEIVACRRIARAMRVVHEVERFPTTTAGLLALTDWLEAARVTHAAMEATGVCWKPGWHIFMASSG